MALVSIEGRFIKVNQSLCNMLGYSQGALLQIGFQNITHPDDLETDLGFVQDLLQGRLNHYDMEKRYFHKKGGIIWVLLSVSLLRSGAGDPIHFVSQIQDITERKKLEQQLRQSQKMEMLGQLTGGIAHDFNNLLAVIQLNLGMIRERLRDDPEADEMAGESLEAIKRGANLTDQLLAFARRQSLQPEAVNIGTLVSGMASLLRRTLGETINITTNIPAGLWATKIDPHKLENALLNLALNSLHAMTEGGSVVLEASNTVLDEFYVAKHLDVLPGDYVMVTVTDTGVGMSPDVLERALEPFFTTKPVGKGSGLGLSMVLGFVKQSGGHLTIDSEPGRGVRVNLYLPRSSGEASHVTATHYQEIPPPAPGEMVLVVEDDQVLRGLALRILNDLGYQTIGAEDGPTALTILDSADHVDLLLTDVVLPKGMNGPELARRVRSRRPAAKVLFMSGYPRDAAFGDGGPEDSAQILTKPFSKEELVYMVRKTMVERNES